MDPIVIGIDVSKDKLDVHVLPAEEAFAVARNGAGIEELAARLAALAPAVVAIEATGGFETIVAAGLAGAGLPVVVVNPAQIRAYAKAIKQRAKTDPIDAAVIAKFARATRPEVRPLPDEATRQLADLVARRRQIVEMMAAEGQRGRRVDHKRVARSIARVKKTLEAELASSTRRSAIRCADRRCGARKRISSSRCPASARSSPAPSWPSCPSSAASSGARSRPSPALPPSPGSRGGGAAGASSAEAAPPCAPSSSSPP
jgi:transposase